MPIRGPYNVGMIIYEPKQLSVPERWLSIPPNLNGSAWRGMECVIEDILDRFDVKRKVALEFGAEYGYSAVAFSNFFEKVIAVDTFLGDEHSGIRQDFYETTRQLVAPYPNVYLVQQSWEEYSGKAGDAQFDLIHIDIVHTYEATMGSGSWAVQHSPCVLFHDSMSFPQVSWACADIANKFGKKYYNYIKDFGLGIIVG